MIVSLLVFTGCSKAIYLNKLITPNVDLPQSKNISIKKFKNDNISQASNISSILTSLKVDNKSYFNVVNRGAIQDVLNEHKLKDLGVVGDGSVNGELLEISSFISGAIITKSMNKSYFKIPVNDYTRCLAYKNDKCVRYKQRYDSCQKNVYYLTTHIMLTDVSSSQVLFENTYSKNDEITHCRHDNVVLAPKEVIMNELSKEIAKLFVRDIAPYYIRVRVEVLDDLDVELKNDDEKMFENSLKALQSGAYEEASSMLSILNKKTHSRSSVVLYNLALSMEGLGKISEAEAFYEKSKKIAIHQGQDLDEILSSLRRIKK